MEAKTAHNFLQRQLNKLDKTGLQKERFFKSLLIVLSEVHWNLVNFQLFIKP